MNVGLSFKIIFYLLQNLLFNTSYVFIVRILGWDLQNINLGGVSYHECDCEPSSIF
jgi:hypothetical protein